MKQKVLFVCNHNAGRSQMAEAILNSRYGESYEARSAGLSPASGMNQNTVDAMAEWGLDLSACSPKPLSDFEGMRFDDLVIMCGAGEDVSFPPAGRTIRRLFSDPYHFSGSEEEVLKGFRGVRDEISTWIDLTFGEAHLEIRWHHRKDPMSPVFCSDSGRPLSQVLEEITSLLEARGVKVSLLRIPLEDRSGSDLNRSGSDMILLNGRRLEDIVPIYVPKACSCCGGCEGVEGACQKEVPRYEGIPESALRLAALRASGLK